MTEEEFGKKYQEWLSQMPKEATPEEETKITKEEQKEQTVFEASNEQYQKWEKENWPQD